MVKIIIGADHAGFNVKEKLKKYFDGKRIKYEDVGTHSLKMVDYPDYAKKVARRIVKDKNTRGILICGTGTGMVIAANKIKGSRAVVAYDNYSAKMSRMDNDANILALRGRYFPYKKTQQIVNIWLNSKFSGNSRHKKRIKKIE
jgi:ribose 5-phosphate isomerase B